MSNASEMYNQDLHWEHAKDFIDHDTGMCIRVNYAEMPNKYPNGVPMRKYSFELIRTKDGSPERVSRFFPMMMSVRNGKATIENINLSVLNTLITDAERWALGQRQDREDRVREQRIRSEKESASEK